MKTLVKWNKDQLNKDIHEFDAVSPISDDMKITFEGISRMVMLDRYSYKDTLKKTLKPGDIVVLTVKDDPDYPARGVGLVQEINYETQELLIWLEEDFRSSLTDPAQIESGLVTRSISSVDKPLEIYYEQIAQRNARGLSQVEEADKRDGVRQAFFDELSNKRIVPAGRVLYGAGSNTDVTYFNCYVMPYVHDSREGISKHRAEVMEIMSRGGGVGTNGSTLRPRHTLARGVNGKSSGAVSWLNDLSTLTHLVEQGGSRRGAQMIMLADWHPDILEFIISKMQNPNVLRYLANNSQDKEIVTLAEKKLKFIPLSDQEKLIYQKVIDLGGLGLDEDTLQSIRNLLDDGGEYVVNKPDFLTGANISVAISDDFMEALKEDKEWELRFPDVENYTEQEMADYNEKWHEVGDVREWEKLGYSVRVYRTIRARDLWGLINVCATYSAEPGVFFIDNANKDTNAKAYGQKVVATNPCGEQPLAPYSVCNLASINLAEFVDKDKNKVNLDKLKQTVTIAIRMQDNVIDSTPYFLEANRKQALGERRVGLGVMGLADMMIYCKVRYGSHESLKLIDEVFSTICYTAYRSSIDLAKEKESFPFLVGDSDEETMQLRHNFINTGFMKRMPQDIRRDILKYGIRNSHLLTVAPTGSTGTMMGVSTGLEPYFAFKYYRSGRLGKFIEVNSDIVQEYLDKYPDSNEDNLPDYFVSAMELSPQEHVDVQTSIQKWVDSSISKTVNAPSDYTVEDVSKIYQRLYEGGAKGGTVYVDGSRDSQVLTLTKDEEEVEDVSNSSELPAQTKEVLISFQEFEDIKYGTNIGDICPICRHGLVEDIGGCNTCQNCNAQLVCGL